MAPFEQQDLKSPPRIRKDSGSCWLQNAVTDSVCLQSELVYSEVTPVELNEIFLWSVTSAAQ